MIKYKKKMPMPVTINDCCLLWQMGYSVAVNDGRVISVTKRKAGLKSAIKNILINIMDIQAGVFKERMDEDGRYKRI